MRAVHIRSFESTGHLTGKKRTYEAVKEAALAAGRFSCFEASDGRKNQDFFTRLCRDPEIEVLGDKEGYSYPWTGVRRKVVSECPQFRGEPGGDCIECGRIAYEHKSPKPPAPGGSE